MTKPILSEQDKDEIEAIYRAGTHNQVELADMYNCSQRTIRRALIERAVLISTECKQVSLTLDERLIMDEVRRYKLRPGSIPNLMNKPAFTRRNVELYLASLPSEELTQTLNAVTLAIKIRREREIKELIDSQEASNG